MPSTFIMLRKPVTWFGFETIPQAGFHEELVNANLCAENQPVKITDPAYAKCRSEHKIEFHTNQIDNSVRHKFQSGDTLIVLKTEQVLKVVGSDD